MYRLNNMCRRVTALLALVAGLWWLPAVQAAVPGITGSSFNLTASAEYISQPDGAMIYSLGYGCSAGYIPTFVPFSPKTGGCPLMQIPGPTLIVSEGSTVSITLTNALPAAIGNTSIVFAGMTVTSLGGVDGLTTKEAAPGIPVTYTFTATKPGTYAYYSGSQPDVQVAMGLYGAIVVLPSAPPTCTSHIKPGETAFGLAPAAYDHPDTCYDREYLFQFSEIDTRLNDQVLAAVQACPAAPCPALSVKTEPSQPQYFLINGRSMPDVMDQEYSPAYVHQPYNGNPHMHPGDLVLLRVIGQGRYQHPFHIHGNHARLLAIDGNLIQVKNDTVVPARLAGPLLFTIPTVSGQAQDLIYTWTGQGLNWDVYGTTDGHLCNGLTTASPGFDPSTHEYCPDHGKKIPVTPPDPNIVANGLWYGGTPYLGMQSTSPNPLPPGANIQNPGAGYAYMWHSHNEREITTNNVFPGGMMMMLIIEHPATVIDESL
ncbi:MAG: multicopper oxidase domain-containing protein [Gammaproteobacteria bacterium]|nr:multicopper oxidase domain-containing protein [Gammaproteobacteria bacterium]